jgi:sec-independent protein translocase protein TatB
VRTAVSGVRQQVNEQLGDDLPELRDLDLRKYHPKTFIRSQLFDDEPPAPPVRRRGSTAASRAAASSAAAASVSTAARPRDPATPPPFDLDAT